MYVDTVSSENKATPRAHFLEITDAFGLHRNEKITTFVLTSAQYKTTANAQCIHKQNTFNAIKLIFHNTHDRTHQPIGHTNTNFQS